MNFQNWNKFLVRLPKSLVQSDREENSQQYQHSFSWSAKIYWMVFGLPIVIAWIIPLDNLFASATINIRTDWDHWRNFCILNLWLVIRSERLISRIWKRWIFCWTEEASIVGAVLSAIIMLGYEGLELSYNFSEMVPWIFWWRQTYLFWLN